MNLFCWSIWFDWFSLIFAKSFVSLIWMNLIINQSRPNQFSWIKILLQLLVTWNFTKEISYYLLNNIWIDRYPRWRTQKRHVFCAKFIFQIVEMFCSIFTLIKCSECSFKKKLKFNQTIGSASFLRTTKTIFSKMLWPIVFNFVMQLI